MEFLIRKIREGQSHFFGGERNCGGARGGGGSIRIRLGTKEFSRLQPTEKRSNREGSTHPREKKGGWSAQGHPNAQALGGWRGGSGGRGNGKEGEERGVHNGWGVASYHQQRKQYSEPKD